MTNVSHAATNGFTELANSPSITIAKPSNKKLEAIKITIKAPATSQLNAVRIYNKEKSTMDNNDILSTKFIANSSKMSGNYYTQMVYEIPKRALPKKNKTQVITIIARANNMEKTRKVVSVTNKDGKYYVLNNAPNITGIQYSGNNVEISMKSTGQEIKSIEVIDTNNSKSVNSSNKLPDVKISKGKLSLKNDEYYRIRIKVRDKNGAYTVKDVAFKLPADEQCNHEGYCKYITTSTQHILVCGKCGKELKTDYHEFSCETLMKHTEYISCKICDYICKHEDVSYYSDTYCHFKYCNTCGQLFEKEEHNYNNNECTICKIKKEEIKSMYVDDVDDVDDLKSMINTSPKIETLSSSDTLDDIKILVSKSPTLVKIYETDSQGKNKKELNLTKSKESTSKKSIYVLSNKKLLKGGTHYFYITAKNKYGTSTRYYQIKKASKTANYTTIINYYAINSSPRISTIEGTDLYSESVNLSGFHINVKDNNGVKEVKVKDMNNNNKQVYSYIAKTTTNTRKVIVLDLNKNCKAKDGIYKIKVEMKDKSNPNKVSTQIITINTKTSGWKKVKDTDIEVFY